MILTITLNPCVDKSTRVPLFEPEAKLRCDEIKNEPGGGGINVSKALKKLNVASTALLLTGGHNGKMLCSLLSNENITYHSTEILVETRENWIVLETSTNRQYRFTFPGKPVEAKVANELIKKMQSLTPAIVVLSGSLPPGLPIDFYNTIIKSANAIGAKCIADTSGAALQALKNANAFLIKPNIGELGKMMGVEAISKNDVPAIAKKAIAQGYATVIVVSMGAEGAWLITENEEHFVTAPPVEKKSTVGAGDSMVAGITFYLEKGATLKEALQFGVACGSAATMNEGTQLFKIEDAERLYKQLNEN